MNTWFLVIDYYIVLLYYCNLVLLYVKEGLGRYARPLASPTPRPIRVHPEGGFVKTLI